MKFKALFCILVLLILPLLITSCTVENTLIKRTPSPNEAYVAIAFDRGGGASSDFSRQVSIYKKDKVKSNKSGNVFIGSGSEFIDIYWEDSSTLVVVHDRDKDDIFKQEKEKYGVKIKYIKKSGN